MNTNYLFFFFCFLLSVTLNAANMDSSKKITKITVEGSNGSVGQFSYCYMLFYDNQGRITKIVPDHPETFGITTCEYGKNTFRIMKGETNVSCMLNEQGYIYVAENNDFPVSIYGNLFYDNKGELDSVRVESTKIVFTWKNGDIVQLNAGDEQIDFTYTPLENKNRLGLLLMIDGENCTAVFPYYALLGKPTQHLPESVAEGEWKANFQYKMDKDGFIDEFTMIFPNNIKSISYRFTYE